MLAILMFGVVAGTATAADPLDTWYWRSPSPQGNPLNGVCFGADEFVAVGANGTVMTSPDGAAWRSSSRSNSAKAPSKSRCKKLKNRVSDPLRGEGGFQPPGKGHQTAGRFCDCRVLDISNAGPAGLEAWLHFSHDG